MPDRAPAQLGRLVADTRVLALVGLAKNTGKTVALRAILAEHAAAGRAVGVTSIGRDGERHDVIDARIEKPSVELQAGDLVASTGALLRASGVEHERFEQTGVRTPLGEVVLARLTRPGAIEVAGPSAAGDARAVAERMLELGAQQALIDGAIDRRAASSPAVADGLVIATGAVLAERLEEVVARTSDAVDLVRLTRAERDEEHVALARSLVLNAEPEQIAALLRKHPAVTTFVVDGALGERFLDGLLAARNERSGRELRIVAADPTHVFLTRRGPRWYARQGVSIEVLQTIALKAITVNPLAPQSHSFDSRELRESIESAVSDVPVLDVLDASYLAAARGA
ncbi:MAG TPA: hypothetical protein VH081_12315 [Solirubrobacteraceae bacterium]|jgi:hypothetical protein|nr:hypothetical protein [Solirubrobacteraceae bacterium]